MRLKYASVIVALLLGGGTFVIGVNAQPVFSTGNLPENGTSVKWTLADTVGVKAGNGGENVTWDFSQLVLGTEQIQNSWVDPSTTPYGSSFTGATHCEKSDTVYSYFALNGGRWTRLGEESAAFQSGPWSNALDVAMVPWQFSQTYTDDARHTFTTNGVPVKRGGTITGTYDGYGTLILPKGTFTNVMRITYTQVITDTMTISAGPFTINTIIKNTVTSSTWFEPNNPELLLAVTNLVTRSTVSGPSPSDNTIYTRQVAVSTRTGGGGLVLDPPELTFPESESDVELTKARLEFTSMVGAKGYRVQLSRQADFGSVLIDTTVTNTSVSLSGLEVLRVYYWRAASVSGSAISKLQQYVQAEPKWSAVQSFRIVPSAPLLKAPSATAVQPGLITFSWTSEMDSNEIEYSTDSTFATGSMSSLVDGKMYSVDIDNPSRYFWRVRCVRPPDFEGQWSSVASFTVSLNVSVAEQTERSQPRIFPNISADYVDVNLEGLQAASVAVVNSTGRLIQLRNVKGLSVVRENVSELPAGAYFVVIITADNKTIVERVFVSR